MGQKHSKKKEKNVMEGLTGVENEAKVWKKLLFKEENPHNLIPGTPLVISFDDSKIFQVKNEIESTVPMMENYGMIPVEVIHCIMLWLRPDELLNLAPVCKVFHYAFSMNSFWKQYYSMFFCVDKRMKKEEMSDMNWKKVFYKRYVNSGENLDRIFRKQYVPRILPTSVTDFKKWRKEGGNVLQHPSTPVPHDQNEFAKEKKEKLLLIGKKGIGKRKFLSRMEYQFHTQLQKKTKEEEVKKVSGHFSSDYRNYEVDISIEDCEIGKKFGCRTFQSGVFICFSLDEKSSFDLVRKRILPDRLKEEMVVDLQKKKVRKPKTELEEKLEKLKQMSKDIDWKEIDGRKPIVLVGLGSEIQVEDRKVTRSQILHLTRSYGLKAYVECSFRNDCCCFLPMGIMLDKLISDQERKLSEFQPQMVQDREKVQRRLVVNSTDMS